MYNIINFENIVTRDNFSYLNFSSEKTKRGVAVVQKRGCGRIATSIVLMGGSREFVVYMGQFWG